MVQLIFSTAVAFLVGTMSVIAMPAPAIPSNCLATYNVQPGDTCGSIVNRFQNFTATDLYKWNPEINTRCTGLIAYQDVCIKVPGYTYQGPILAGDIYTRDQTPVPVQPEIVANCNKFEYTDSSGKPGFAEIFRQNRITKTQWNQWNWPSQDPTKDQSLFAGYFSCVGL